MSVAINIEHAVKRFGDKTIIPDLCLHVKEGEFFTLLGSSGCGKTTLLRMIAGFNTIEGGDFYFNDKRINDLPPHTRNIGMVFQNYAIFPHMSAGKNVGYGLKQRKVKEPELSRRVDEMLNVVQISDLKDRMPSKMSGGQQQRIALARAIVIQPDVLLMDEPLSNLDAKLRIEMRSAIKEIQHQYKITTIYVTHDQEEALSMSDRIAVMKHGVIQQIGTPVEIYAHPKNLFVATFIGQSNLLNGKIVIRQNEKQVMLEDGEILATNRLIDACKEAQSVRVCVRPNEMDFSNSGVKGTIMDRTFLGTTMKYDIQLPNQQVIEVSKDAREKIHEIGEDVRLAFDPHHVNIFDQETELSLMKEAV